MEVFSLNIAFLFCQKGPTIYQLNTPETGNRRYCWHARMILSILWTLIKVKRKKRSIRLTYKSWIGKFEM